MHREVRRGCWRESPLKSANKLSEDPNKLFKCWVQWQIFDNKSAAGGSRAAREYDIPTTGEYSEIKWVNQWIVRWENWFEREKTRIHGALLKNQGLELISFWKAKIFRRGTGFLKKWKGMVRGGCCGSLKSTKRGLNQIFAPTIAK